ncbi:hypothetical protein NW768_003980 [Fusarium equiseti]|uniref:Uncharacterized protein n=1 Tax=Fusarium equiseti TaxID=61235 RepID=A0ABQ8RJD6_FUSEQ|nr:hypothetical protein NW768_003980 [Fusarium equiseti]
MVGYGAFNCRRAFFRSEIFDNITVALTVVLKKARYGHAPLGNRYHIVDIKSEKPKLNKTMRFELCRNSTSCNKDNCFDARYSAIKYLVEFLSDSDRFVNVVDETDLENKSLKKLYGLYPAPGEGFLPWMRALVNIFRDLFGQQLEV